MKAKAKPAPQPKPAEEALTRQAKVVAEGITELRTRATLDGSAKDFNGAMVSKDDEVQILLSETTEGIEFYYIMVGRKRGFIRAEYVNDV